jgi:GAF domain-containing protein
MSGVTSALFSEGEVDETLRTIAHQARVLLDADLAVLAVPEREGDGLRLRIADGYGADVYEGATIPAGGSLAGQVMRDRAPLLVPDASADTRAHRDPDWPDDLGPTLVVPLHAGDEALAALSIAHRRGRPMFRVSDVTLMKTFAAHATVAILEARNQVELRLSEVLGDRDRVAMSMQDGVIKRISSAALTLHSVMKLDIPDAAKERLWGVVEELDTAIALARDAVFPR